MQLHRERGREGERERERESKKQQQQKAMHWYFDTLCSGQLMWLLSVPVLCSVLTFAVVLNKSG